MFAAFLRWGRTDNFGWNLANKIFAPSGSYLHREDVTMDWLYKARAFIGAALLILIGIHYHQAAKDITGTFNPVTGGIGGITGPLALALLAVVPATGAVVLYTRKRKRDEAFRQMLRYPVKTALICLGISGFLLGLNRILQPLAHANSFPVEAVFGSGGSILCLRYFLFPFRAVYLVTVGMSRLGDGHPLLPPVVGSIIAWWAAIQGLLTHTAGTGEPSLAWRGALLAAPVSVSLLGVAEISRLRNRFRGDFPFRNGPLAPARDGAAPPESHHIPAARTPPTGSAMR